MNILFLNAYYAPEQISFSHLERELLEALVEDGHHIHVVCPTPTRGVSDEVARQYKDKKRETDYDGHVEVRRFSAPREGKNPLIRAFRYFWCNWRTYRIGKKYKGIDAVFAVSTPPTQGYMAGRVAKKLSCPMIYSLQDVFPDSLVTTGLTREGSLLWKVGRWVEKKTYRLCTKIIVISEACRKNLLDKGVPKEQMILIPNWVDTERILPVEREGNALLSELGLDGSKFLAVYAGNFGAAQGADVVVRAAELLKDDPEIQFVVFGGGALFGDACSLAQSMGLENITMNPLLPQERVPEVYSLGDVALITCKRGVGSSGMPSKTWSIMACNTPIVAAFDTDSELAELLKDSGAGTCVEPEDAEALAAAIREAKKASRDAQSRGTGPRAYVCENASANVCTKKYIDAFKLCLKK